MALTAAAAAKIGAGILGAGAIGSSVLSGFMANAGTYKQYKHQRNLMDRQARLNYEYAEKSALNNATWNRTSLENAGYNPMLAVQNSTSGANSSWTSGGQASAPDYVGAISQGIANAQSFQRLKNETEQAESTADANYATADKAKAEKSEIVARLPFVSKRQKAEIAQLEAGAQLAEAQKHNLKERLDLDRQLGFAGISVQQQANAISAENNKRTNRVNTSLEHIRHPFASFFHKGYTSGKSYKGSYSDPWSH